MTGCVFSCRRLLCVWGSPKKRLVVWGLALLLGLVWLTPAGAGEKTKSSRQQQGNAPGLVDLGQLSAPSKNCLRLASWNVHDLFDSVDDDYKDEVLTPQEYKEKVNALAKVLRGLKADIVGVQEVENAKTLQDLAQRAGYKYSLLVEGNDQARGIDVGVISQVPIKNYVTHMNDACPGPDGTKHKFSRDCLEVHFDHPSKLTMLVNHFKSKRGGNDTTADKRQAQATRVKEIAASLSKYPLIVVGDLNDEPDSQALAPLVQQAGLYDALSWIGKNRVSFKSKKYSSALDYLLLNRLLMPRMVSRSARIVVGSAVKAASDHRPVIVDVKMK